MQSLKEQKRQLRLIYNSRRKAIVPSEWEYKSRAICARIVKMSSFCEEENILVYVASKDNEVYTRAIIQSALTAGKHVLIPVIGPVLGTMRWSRLSDMDSLVRGRFGLLEPASDEACIVPVPEKGLCLVPGIAFTRDGWRLGYGGGYYDRFLDRFRGISVGLAFELQLAPALPRDENDRPVAFLATEAGWYPAVP